MKFEEAPKKETEKSTEREEIIEKARKERKDFVVGMLKTIANHGLDIWPIIGNATMAGKVYLGETLVGKKLTTRDRVVYSIIIALNVLFYIILAKNRELSGLASQSYLAAAGLTGAQKYVEFTRDFPENIKNLQKFAEENDMNSLIEPLSTCKKIIEEYGYDNVFNLMIRINDQKLNASN